MTDLKEDTKEKKELNVDLSLSDEAAILVLGGDFVGSQVVHFRRACTHSEKKEQHRCIVDLTDVESIDGYGLASLVGFLARIKEKGGRVILCGINPDLRKRFEATHCDSIFETAFTVAKALEKLEAEA